MQQSILKPYAALLELSRINPKEMDNNAYLSIKEMEKLKGFSVKFEIDSANHSFHGLLHCIDDGLQRSRVFLNAGNVRMFCTFLMASLRRCKEDHENNSGNWPGRGNFMSKHCPRRWKTAGNSG